MCCPPRGLPLMLPAVTGSHMLADLDSAAIGSASVSTKFTGIGASPLNPRKRLVLCNGPCPLWRVLPYHAVGCIVHHGKFWLPMSALGQKRTCASQNGMSALPPKADMCSATANVRFGPKADITELGCNQRLDFTSLIAVFVAPPLPFHRSPLSSSKAKQLG